MSRIDEYLTAKKIAKEALLGSKPQKMAENSGFLLFSDGDYMDVFFLDQPYRIFLPDFTFTDKNNSENQVPIEREILILHYIAAALDIKVTSQWIAYREIPGASFYFSAFSRRAIEPMEKVFGHNMEGFCTAAAAAGGKLVSFGDAGFAFQVFPKIFIRLILWAGDEEFQPNLTVLFDRTIEQHLSADAIWGLVKLINNKLMEGDEPS